MGSNPIGNAMPVPFSVMDSPQEKRIIRASPGPEGKNLRLDCWLAARFTYRSRAEWQSAIRSGEIRLNGAETRPARVLRGDEIIDFQLPDRQEPSVRTDYRILADFPQYTVLDKPGNLPVHPAGCFFHHTLLMLLQKQYGQMFAVNRLDRETSGTVLLARTPKAAARLAAALSEPGVAKKYLVYVHGCFPAGRMRAAGWLSPDPESVVRKKRRFTFQKPDSPDCETCDTEFLRLHHNCLFSKLECVLHTGRLHQIRATLFSLGFPIVGDKLYGLDDQIFDRFSDGRMTESDKKTLIVDRQALHACKLRMTDPFDGVEKTFSAPVPAELTDLERILFPG